MNFNRVAPYIGFLGLILYGILAMNGIEFRRLKPEYGEFIIVFGMLAALLYFYLDLKFRKEQKEINKIEEKAKKENNYKKIILSIIGLLYIFIDLFTIGYTNDLGFIIALGLIFYANDGLTVLNRKGN